MWGSPIGPNAPRDGIWTRLSTAAVLAALALLSVAPHVYYLTQVAFAAAVQESFGPLGTGRVVRADLLALGTVVLMCSLMGALFAERYGLAGLGDRASLRRGWWLFALAAPAIGIASYLLFGRELAERVPGFYPGSLPWAGLRAVKGALFDEVVARFGMMTILCGVVRRPWAANVLQAAFFTVLGLIGLPFFGLHPVPSAYFAAAVIASLAVHLFLGAVYARLGLLAAVACHLGIGSKYVLHALVGGG
ncbi:MAG: hypothetical protein HY744_02015 [Deltaproteobacteria bacterium]|nr:hypothetical protein [Deltaproteobacteria bacterium]